MRYFVIGDQGQKYGPSDTTGLNQWIGEGRLLPTTILEEEASGMRSAASAVPGLQFAPAAPPAPAPAYPTGTYATAQAPTYSPPQYSEEGIGPALLGVGLGLASPVVTYFIGIGGFICFSYGLTASWRVKDERPALAYAGLALNVLAAAFWVYWRIIRRY